MNWYPTIYHPITMKPINLYSKEINALLSQGYSEYELFGKERVVPQNPLTGIEEIDYNIMMQLPSCQLTILCRVNKYAQKLCQDMHFWLKKLSYDNFIMPSKHLLNNVNWVKAYDVLDFITVYTDKNELDVNDSSKALVNPKYYEQVVQLLNKYNIKSPSLIQGNINYIVFWYDDQNDKCTLYFRELQMISYVDEQQWIDFLFDAMMSNVITKLTEDF